MIKGVSLVWKLPLAVVLGLSLWALHFVHWGSGALITAIGDPWEKM